MSSSFLPALVTQYTSSSKPRMCSPSFRNSVSGTRRGKFTSPWPVRSISARMRLSMRVIAAQPYGVQTSMPFTGYRLSRRPERSTTSLYHSLKSSAFVTMEGRRMGATAK